MLKIVVLLSISVENDKFFQDFLMNKKLNKTAYV